MFFVYQGGNSIAMIVDLTYVIPNVCVGGWVVHIAAVCD